MRQDDEPSTVAIFRTRAAARMAASALEAAGVPAWLEDGPHANRTSLRVRGADAEAARELLAASEGGLPRSPSSDGPSAAGDEA